MSSDITEQSQDPQSLSLIFVTPYYWPQFAACTMLYGSLCSGLVESGMKVTVLTNREHESGPVEPFPIQPYLSPEIVKVWNPFLRKKGILNKVMEYVWFTVFVIWRVLLSRRIDVVFLGSNPPLIGVPIGIVARLKRIRIVYNLQDLFPDSALALELISKKSIFFKLLKKMERLNYKLSDVTITICNSFANHVHKMEKKANVQVIPNWVDTDFMIEISRPQNKFLSGLGLSNKFIILYAGNMGYSHNLDVIIEAAHYLVEHDHIHFLFVGDGNRKLATMESARRKALQNCTFVEFQPFSALPEVYSCCDLGVVSMRQGSEANAIPSKTWNYLSCSKPVIACVESPSELAQAIQDSGSGVVVPSHDAKLLALAVFDLYGSPERCLALGTSGRQYVCREISRPVIVRKYQTALERMMVAIR